MATKMLMPLLGQTMEEGTVIKWFKNEGDTVTEGDPLLEVMTDKVNMEVEAPASGVLRKILAPQDAIIPVKDPICIIGSADESIDDLLGEAAPVEAVAVPVPQAAAAPTEPAASAASAPPAAPAAPPAPAEPVGVEEGRVFASPAAKRIAAEHGVDIAALTGKGSGPNGRVVEKDVYDFLASAPKVTPLAGKIAAEAGVPVGGIPGTGIGGKVTSEDVRRAATQPAAAPAAPAQPAGIGATIPFTGLRRLIAQNVAQSYQNAVHVTLVTEVDMTECAKLRTALVPDVEKRYGVRISFTDLIAKAVAKAIQDKPIVNASLQGDQIVISDHINIGIATALEAGLIVPVVKDVQSKSVVQISQEIKGLVGRAREGKSVEDDLKGGTFTITNLGIYGIESFNPIITPGQSAILAVCAIKEKPAVIGGEIKVRSMMNLCLSFDHRVMDGAPAAEFLANLKAILEAPYSILV